MHNPLILPAFGLAPIDWWVIITYIVVSVLIGILLSKRARKDSESYFKSSGGMPWWLLGTSMVATTFAADTPLVLSGWVVTSGIAQNWFWWCQVPMVMAGVFFFARLWKRANPLTDMEFVYVRYSGKSANFLRGFKALWLAIPYGCLTMGWVNKAMTKVINLTIPDFPHIPIVDSLILSVFLATPLSNNINADVKLAARSHAIRPLAIAQAHDLMTYESSRIFTEVEYGAYENNPQRALQDLGLSDQLSPDTLDGIQGVDPALYREEEKSPTAQEAESPDDTGESSQMVRPVTLADGTVISYETLKQLDGHALTAGQDQLEQDRLGAARKKTLLADMGSVEFLTNVYNIASSVNQYKILLFLFLVTVSYTFISGLWGVMVTDFLQFWIAMFGSILAAVLAVQACGGMEGMMTRMAGIYDLARARAMVSLIPTSKAGGLGLMSMGQFLIFILLVWWSVGFTDGGSIFAQRMLSAKDERHAALGYLWYGVSHFALRMWPWIIVGFAAAILFPFVPYANGEMPTGAVAEDGYVKVLLQVLPKGLLGLLIAAFFAAYMSTISTWIDIGASYLMNDFYRPFIAPKMLKRNPRLRLDEKHYVRVGMTMTLVIAACGILLSLYLNTIAEAWFLLAAFNSGIGVIYLLRWYWHRINAWTEVSCIGALIFVAAVLKWFGAKYGIQIGFPYSLLIALPFSLIVSILVTFMTQPTDRTRLIDFCKRVQPGGPGWKEIADDIRKDDPDWKPKSPLTAANTRNWLLATVTIYCFLFGIGKLVIGDALYPNITGPNAFLGMAALSVLATVGFNKLRPMQSWLSPIGIAVGLFVILMILRRVFGSTTDAFFLNHLFTNRSLGILLLCLGTALGAIVVASFAPRKWSATQVD
jgi:Na+/proline symporter